MDDRAQPAATARVGWTDGIYSQAYYWGRDFGPVSERNAFLTLAGESQVRGAQYLFAHYGIVASEHVISLYDNDASRNNPDAPPTEHDRDYNLGGILGLGLQARAGFLKCGLNWDSHIFFTGSPAIIFLTSGRKQTVSLTFGAEL